jgi:HEAT repeat protein
VTAQDGDAGHAGADDAIARALTSPDPALVRAGTAAALVLTTGSYRSTADPLELPDGQLDLRALLGGLAPRGYTPAEHAQALSVLGPSIARAAAAAVQSSAEGARAVADSLRPRDGHAAFGPLSPSYEGVDSKLVERARAASEQIVHAVVPPFVALTSHPSAEVRAMAVQVLALRSEPPAAAAVIEAVSDRDARVQNAALSAIAECHLTAAAGAIATLLTHAEDWPLRRRAASALGELGSSDSAVRTSLVRAATTDEYALVREAAVRALARVDPSGARAVLAQLVEKDPEPRVRAAARSALGPTDASKRPQSPSRPEP